MWWCWTRVRLGVLGGEKGDGQATMRSKEHVSPTSRPSNPEREREKTSVAWEGLRSSTTGERQGSIRLKERRGKEHSRKGQG